MSEQTTEQAEARLAEKLVKPIDELSTFSVGVVAEAAETIAKAKAEAAVKALEAAGWLAEDRARPQPEPGAEN